MGYPDAITDNVPIDKGYDGFRRYHPPCHICGTPVNCWNYVSGTKYACSECRVILASLEHAKKRESSADKQMKRLDRAVKRISRVTDIDPYDNAISYVQENLDNPGWFQSTEEMMVALELFRRKVVAQHQVRVFEYTIDFLLPEMKVILEIDGSIYHGRDRERREQIRDELISEKLGCEVIRIPTDNINKNVTLLLPAISVVLRNRKRKGSIRR